MTVEEARARLADLNRGYRSPYSSAERGAIERLYYEVLGKPIGGCRCPDKWHDAVLEINSYLKKHGKMREKSNYKLRAGVVLQIAGSSEVYTNDNLTDEVAAAFLKEHPNAARRFEVIPTAKKEAAGGRSGAKSAELEAAHARIAALEAEKAELESRCAALQARIDAANGAETSAEPSEEGDGGEKRPTEGGAETEGAGTTDEKPAEMHADATDEADDAIRKAVAAELVAGKSKTAIRQAMAGKEIGGVKLTHRLVSEYIERITAEE